MGAAASIESQKPVDASDIQAQGFEAAKAEIIRLRRALGHLSEQNGFGIVVIDASDICLNENQQEDFERCLKEIIHIRSALRLSTQSSRRRSRAPNVFEFGNILNKMPGDRDDDDNSSTSSSSSNEDEDLKTNDDRDDSGNVNQNTTTTTDAPRK